MIETPHQDHQENAQVEEHLREPLSSLGIELTRISAEIQSINSGFQAQIQQALTDVQVAFENRYKDHFEKAISQARYVLENQFKNRLDRAVEEKEELLKKEIQADLQVQFEAELAAKLSNLTKVKDEIVRVTTTLETVSKEIAVMIDDPSVELSRIIRKKSEQSELRAYLNGLIYSTGEPRP